MLNALVYKFFEATTEPLRRYVKYDIPYMDFYMDDLLREFLFAEKPQVIGEKRTVLYQKGSAYTGNAVYQLLLNILLALLAGAIPVAAFTYLLTEGFHVAESTTILRPLLACYCVVVSIAIIRAYAKSFFKPVVGYDISNLPYITAEKAQSKVVLTHKPCESYAELKETYLGCMQRAVEMTELYIEHAGDIKTVNRRMKKAEEEVLSLQASYEYGNTRYSLLGSREAFSLFRQALALGIYPIVLQILVFIMVIAAETLLELLSVPPVAALDAFLNLAMLFISICLSIPLNCIGCYVMTKQMIAETSIHASMDSVSANLEAAEEKAEDLQTILTAAVGALEALCHCDTIHELHLLPARMETWEGWLDAYALNKHRFNDGYVKKTFSAIEAAFEANDTVDGLKASIQHAD